MVENFLHELKNGRSYELELLLFVAYTTYKQVQQNLRRTRDLLQKNIGRISISKCSKYTLSQLSNENEWQIFISEANASVCSPEIEPYVSQCFIVVVVVGVYCLDTVSCLT